MSNDEQHEMLIGIFNELVPVLSCDELSLLAHHCGIGINEFYGSQPDLLVSQPELLEAA